MLPPAAEEAFRNSYYTNAARNSLLYDELRRVLNVFRQENIEVIALKGAALAETVYPHKALRPMADIDLLVRKEKLGEVETRLLDLGYVLERPLNKEWFQQHYYHLVFAKQHSIKIEIHWHIGRGRLLKVSVEGFWERAQMTTIAGVEALTLAPEDLLLHLCQHAWKHNWTGGVRPLCDIAESTKFFTNKIDWRKVAAASSEWQIAPYVYLGLRLARDMLEAAVPESCLKELEPVNFNPVIINWTKERLLTNPEPAPVIAGRYGASVFGDLVQLFGKGHGFKERWAVLRKIFSANAMAKYYRYPYASKRIHFVYLLRLKHLLARYGPVVWKLIAGNRKVRAAADRAENQLQLTKWLSNQ